MICVENLNLAFRQPPRIFSLDNTHCLLIFTTITEHVNLAIMAKAVSHSRRLWRWLFEFKKSHIRIRSPFCGVWSYSGNTWLCVHWQWNTLEWCQLNALQAWSAFSWHHSSVFHCQWTHNQVFLLLSHTNLKCKKVYSFMWWNMSGFIWKLGINFAIVSSGLTKLDETISYCWCQIVMRWSLWLQQWSLWLHHCDVIHWDKQSCVTMAVDL